MGNFEKHQHGKSFQESLEYFIINLNSTKELCNLTVEKRLGYEEYDPKQFYIPYEITFSDDTVWAVYSTTSMRDRFKGQLLDAYNVKQLDERIECAYLVYPDSISEKERKAFESKAKSIENGTYYSYIDHIVSESEFQLLLEEKAMDSAGLSNGVQGDRRGRSFERLIVDVMRHDGNLARLKNGSASNESGYSYNLFTLIVNALNIETSMIESIDATNKIPQLPSGGSGKTDVVVYYRMTNGDEIEQKISCKRTLKDKVSVNQYSAKEILRVLGKDDNSDVAKAIKMFEECGSGSALKDKYGSNGLEFVKKSIETGLSKEDLYRLTKWVVSGYGADNPSINCADWILIRKGHGSDCFDQFFSTDDYVNILLNEEPLQMGTPFDWTFASGQRGKSIQFKMKTSH